MRRIPKFVGVFAALTLIWIPSGCGGGMKLAYKSPPRGVADKGMISVVVDDRRPANRGGDDPHVVGTLRNAFGMPFAVKAAPNREPSQVVAELISECLQAAGYRVVDQSADAPRLSAALEQFWSDGYQHNRLWVVMPLDLRGNGSSAPVWSKELRVNEGWNAKTVGFRQMNSGYNRLLETTKNELLREFNSPQFREHYQSL
jgi:hypothetical protein